MQITMEKAPMQAGILCNDVAFQNYAAMRHGFPEGSFGKSESAEHIRQICGVTSRSELATSPKAFHQFENSTQILRLRAAA
ncbi:hypothetical protein [Phaeobacter sp. 11ANDIMAR09]|uniref:hypothetical protein n=1 Tax=Phaeobacter sp. 11ANDIMAR09 TaxID=1225647 RepID=UPI0006C88E6E|nr:hypothetical protein [Phaeobacter sp. 11ANDIMAR09]